MGLARTRYKTLTARQSLASHQAAKPELIVRLTSKLIAASSGANRHLTSDGEAAQHNKKTFSVRPLCSQLHGRLFATTRGKPQKEREHRGRTEKATYELLPVLKFQFYKDRLGRLNHRPVEQKLWRGPAGS